MKALQFGVNLSTSASPGTDPVGDALTAERLGYDFVSASDHPCGVRPTNETWTMLTWVAASTTTIRVATRVLGVPFRNPVLLAKMAETLGRLSGGRLILGLGTGAARDEISALGILALSDRERVAALEEAVMIIRGVWASPAFTYEGAYHQSHAAEIQPQPDRPIPLWLGTFGDRALAVTGRTADGWIPSLGYAPADQLEGMRDKVFAAAKSAGRQPEDLDLVLNVEVHVGDMHADTADALIGPAATVADRLMPFLDLGFTGFNFMPLGPDLLDQYKRLALEVVPLLRNRT